MTYRREARDLLGENGLLDGVTAGSAESVELWFQCPVATVLETSPESNRRLADLGSCECGCRGFSSLKPKERLV